MKKPISRKFIGRSLVAKNKLRFKGRFVKKNSVIKKSFFKVLKNKGKSHNKKKSTKISNKLPKQLIYSIGN